VRFENKNIFFYFEKRASLFNLLALYLVENSEVAGLAPVISQLVGSWSIR
jgi:hypothetical protein